MSLLQWINTLVVALGVPTIIVALIYIGRKLQILDTLEKSSDKIKHNMKVVSDYLTRHHNKFDPKELQTMSPLNLTEIGKQFVEKVGFDNIFKKNKTDFFACIDNENAKLKYDVEVASIKAIYALYDKPYMDFLKVYFYNHPNRSMENTAPTLGVYIRDVYLSEHPEITQ